MRKLVISVALFSAVAIFAANGSTTHAQTKSESKKQTVKVVVKSGDSLSKIAKKHKSTYKRVYYANVKIKHPDLIYPGDKLRVPGPKEKLKQRAMPGTTQASQTTSVHVSTTPRSQVAQSIPVYSAGSSTWDRLAQCEAGGNWAINTGNGYYGGLQFTLSSWRGVGGSGYPHQASKSEQIARGKMLQASSGWGAWPACTAQLGLR